MNFVREQITLFIVMFSVGIFLNPMSLMAYKMDDLYISVTLVYGGFIMASNMMWAHQIVHLLNHGRMNNSIFILGLLLSLFFIFLSRNQIFVSDIEWLKRMISHHSTALTSTTKLLENNDFKNNPKLYRLAKDIVYNQNIEILTMKTFLPRN